jgi:spermidine/putrescine transport system ATP-binding protein
MGGNGWLGAATGDDATRDGEQKRISHETATSYNLTHAASRAPRPAPSYHEGVPLAEPVVELVRVSKSFPGTVAVRDVSFTIERGEFFSMLGPSGCGKTTTLRLIAGFETPDADGGEVRLLGAVVNDKRPYERQIAMVFQNYALFPHLNVERNIAFGLEQRKPPHRAPKTEIADRVRAALQLVRLDPGTFARRLPAQLSGGQRQRVALARAIVLEPAILLLDEPLGAIDLQLRKEMQLELKSLNKQLGTTFIYVTHDQEEALTMSDRIAVMSNARVAQLGTPAEIYENPRTAFVAKFIGESNFFDGRVAERCDTNSFAVTAAAGGQFRVPAVNGLAPGQSVRIAVRPEWLDIVPVHAVPPGENALRGSVRDVVYLGETMHVVVTVGGGADVTVAVRNEGQLINPLPWKRGDEAAVAWRPEDCQILEDE